MAWSSAMPNVSAVPNVNAVSRKRAHLSKLIKRLAMGKESVFS